MSLESAYIDFLTEIKNEIAKEVKLEVARISGEPILHVYNPESNTITARATAPGSSVLAGELPILAPTKTETKPSDTKPIPPGQAFVDKIKASGDKKTSKFLDDILGTWEGGKK